MRELIPDGSSQHGRFGDYIVTSMKYDSDAETCVFTSISIGLLRSVTASEPTLHAPDKGYCACHLPVMAGLVYLNATGRVFAPQITCTSSSLTLQIFFLEIGKVAHSKL